MKKYFLGITFALIVLASCSEKEPVAEYYYPVDSLIQAQVKFLIRAHAIITKTAVLDNTRDSTSFTPKDSAAWMHELDVFAELRTINKPINRGSYQVETGIKDSNSNLLITSIKSLKKLPVVYLTVYYLNTSAAIRKIEALYQEESSLLKTSRILTMEFQNIHNKNVLTSYSIVGGQKMLIGDSVKFSVNALVTLP